MRTAEIGKLVVGLLLLCGLGGACSSSKRAQIAPESSVSDGGPDPSEPSPEPTPPPLGNESGSRLKARTIVGEDGSKEFLGWFDSQRNEECSYIPAADGKRRCLPVSIGTGGAFSDGECSRALAQTFKGCAAPAYVTSSEAISACRSSGAHVFKRGGPYSGELFYKPSDACVPYPPTAGLTFDYEIGDEVALADFVSATVNR